MLETAADIKKGKYETWKDEWGDMFYRKVRFIDRKQTKARGG